MATSVALVRVTNCGRFADSGSDTGPTPIRGRSTDEAAAGATVAAGCGLSV
jgi:putative component of membrane protein insertase Oxa1/YidC/SpoIIIJ protein YidD